MTQQQLNFSNLHIHKPPPVFLVKNFHPKNTIDPNHTNVQKAPIRITSYPVYGGRTPQSKSPGNACESPSKKRLCPDMSQTRQGWNSRNETSARWIIARVCPGISNPRTNRRPESPGKYPRSMHASAISQMSCVVMSGLDLRTPYRPPGTENPVKFHFFFPFLY